MSEKPFVGDRSAEGRTEGTGEERQARVEAEESKRKRRGRERALMLAREWRRK